MQQDNKIQLILQPRDTNRKYVYDYHAHIEINKEEHQFGNGGGVALDVKTAKLKAICEAIERYAASADRGKDYLKSSFSDIRDSAINPKRLIYFQPWQYTRSFPFSKFNPRVKIDWIEAVSVTNHKNTNIFLPAFGVYLGYNATQSKKLRFSPTTSNGLALGHSISEAFERGLLELIERDAALLSWYTQRTPPKINLASLANPDIKFVERSLLRENLSLDVCLATCDIPIPSVIAIIREKNSFPSACLGLGCEFDLEKAVLKAILEAIMVRNTMEMLPLEARKILRRNQIKTFMDHALYYSVPSHQKPLEKLFSGPVFSKKRLKSKFKFNKSLTQLIDFLSKKNMEILICDLTTPLIKSMGYSAVKTIIPELQQIDISYKARFLGSSRLEALIGLDGINPYPHPFA